VIAKHLAECHITLRFGPEGRSKADRAAQAAALLAAAAIRNGDRAGLALVSDRRARGTATLAITDGSGNPIVSIQGGFAISSSQNTVGSTQTTKVLIAAAGISAEHVPFPDHHPYTAAEIEALAQRVRDLTGGATGIAGVPPFGIGGLRAISDAGSFWLVWFVFALGFWLAWGIVHSPVGNALRAIKQDELAAASNGINVFGYKTIAFLLAAGYASVAGSLFAHQLRFISPDSVNWVVSTGLVTMLVLGGEGTLWGVLPGALLLQLLPEVFNPLQDYLLIVQGIVLVAVQG